MEPRQGDTPLPNDATMPQGWGVTRPMPAPDPAPDQWDAGSPYAPIWTPIPPPPPPGGWQRRPQRPTLWLLAGVLTSLAICAGVAAVLRAAGLPSTINGTTGTSAPAATFTTAPTTTTPTATPSPTALPMSFAVALVYNNIGISDDSAPDAANFDSRGNSYSAQALAANGFAPGETFTFDGVTFTWPDSAPGTADNMLAQGQTLEVAVTQPFNTLAIVGASSLGGSQGTLIITYTDGSTQHARLGLSDWTLPGGDLQYGNKIVTKLPVINRPDGQHHANSYLFYAAISLKSDKTITSITLPSPDGQSTMHIICIGAK